MKGKRDNVGLALVLALGGVVLFSLLDRLYPQVTLAPLAGAVILFALALFFGPVTITKLAILLGLYVGWSLATVPDFDWTDTETRVRFAIRITTFGVAVLIAVLASFFRTQLTSMLEQTKELLAELPVGVLLSDAGGRVVWGNRAAEKILGVPFVVGRTWWELMPSDGRPIHYEVAFAAPSEAAIGDYFPEHVVRLVKVNGLRKPLLTTVIYAKPGSEAQG